MYQAIAAVQLVLFLFLMFKFLKHQGIIVLVDPVKMMFILWMLTLILYDFKLSSLYKPTLLINIIVIIMWVSFLIMGGFIKLKNEDIVNLFKGFRDRTRYKRYFHITNILFILGALAFAYNIHKYGLAITQKNKINKQVMEHFSAYLVYMLVLVAEIKYVLFRNYRNFIDLLVLILSVITLLLTLNRGPMAFLLLAIGLYEIFNFINIKKYLSKRTEYIIYGTFILAVLIFMWFFGYVGNLRMEYALKHVFKTSIAKHYGVSELMPTGFLWFYIYLTSPLENAAFSLANQKIQYTYFNNLLYPVVKFFADIFGKGDIYKNWFNQKASYVPYLYKKVGLNAPSFIPNSFNDLGIVGFIVYVAIYIALAYLAIKLIKKAVKLSSVGKVVIFANIATILIWSVFDNSFKMPIPLLNIIVLLLVEWDFRKRKNIYN